MYNFTKKKFLALSLERQHKKCTELLRQIYDQHHKQKKHSAQWQNYQELLQWMQEPQCEDSPTPKLLADRYHYHLQLAGISKREHHLLPQIRKGDRIEGEKPWPIAIYLDHLRSAHNVGSIIRTIEAFALGTLYFSPQTPFITNNKVKSTSMGSFQGTACQQGTELAALPQPIITLETGLEALSIFDFIFPSSFTLVVGNEEYGCSDDTLALTNYLIEIPLRGRKNSLNVANAFAIAAGEISRQRHQNVVR